MGNTLAAGGSASGGPAFTPSDGFFLMDASRQGSLAVLELFLKKNPALVFAHSADDNSTAWHYASQVSALLCPCCSVSDMEISPCSPCRIFMHEAALHAGSPCRENQPPSSL
jgi:hypothetical protein